ncbi:MAG: metallophosphoesterase [Acidobacteria bacterium]|nr:metallophosphoesterase [Acidobacteriota bacterium]
MVARLGRLRPDVLFIAGDFFDGVKVGAGNLAAELKHFSAPFGACYVTGNHEEFSNPSKYLEAMGNAGVRVLNNERVTFDGLDVVGVHHADSVRPERLRSILQDAGLGNGRASILIVHTPHRLEVAEEQGVSLQLSGHTHAGQIYPFIWLIRRVFRQYAYGLNRFGKMMVYTSSGCGTWGPPMRVGTRPELVLIEFE